METAAQQGRTTASADRGRVVALAVADALLAPRAAVRLQPGSYDAAGFPA